MNTITFAGQEPQTETLTWHQVADAMPDSDITVLLWVLYEDGDTEWASGWWDGEVWRDSTGAPVFGEVMAWSEPNGPAA